MASGSSTSMPQSSQHTSSFLHMDPFLKSKFSIPQKPPPMRRNKLSTNLRKARIQHEITKLLSIK
eukprot:474488-Karenia_brevis.AAC.1